MRTYLSLNEGWSFIRENVGPKGFDPAKAVPVTLPHTWNNLDGQDGGNDYYRGLCWYRRELVTPVDLGSDLLFLDFAGVESIAKVYMNGELIACHEGGFSRFRIPITSYLKAPGETNELMVSADNSPNDSVYPQFADFTFFGGIYREVKLIRVSNSHFDLDYYGAPGITVSAEPEGEDARLTVHVYTDNAHAGQAVRLRIEGDNAPEDRRVELNEGAGEILFALKMEQAHRWHGTKDPYLYKLSAVLYDGSTELDRVSVFFGIREFSVDPEKGFFLNGEAYPLRGVCRHQDRLDKGWAIGLAEHEEDMALIRELGANTIRLAHYQHDEAFYELCDRYGLIVWAEIPFISQKLEKGQANEISQMKELVLQNINHPSIVCWGLSNEITIGGQADEDLLARHRKLNDLCHTLDPSRLTTMAQVSALPIDSPMNELSDLRSYNIYYGWYGGETEESADFIDSFHAAHPDLPLGISEYGCEAILDWHSAEPVQGDYSEEYQALYHEKMAEILMSRPFLWATHLWNMFDFAADSRDEGGRKGRNHKGLVTYDRKTKKDSFYLYKAWWNPEPMVHLCAKRFEIRAEKTVSVKVYSNLPEVELFVNGKSFGKKNGSKVFVFENVPLHLGPNRIAAVSGELRDEMVLRRHLKPNRDYVLANSAAVANWFDEKMEFPEGYFSIRDKIGDIMDNPEGKALLEEMLGRAMTAGGVADSMPKMDEGMMKMARSFTIERIARMIGDKLPAEALVSINQELNKIKKVK